MKKKKKMKWWKKLLLWIFIPLFIIVTVIASMQISIPYTIRSEERHLEVLEKRMRKYYLESDRFDGKYTDLKVYPLYNQNEEFVSILVELEPYGFVIVYMATFNLWFSGFYTVNSEDVLIRADLPWQRYRIGIGGIKPNPHEGIMWKPIETKETYREHSRTNYYEVDGDGEFVYWNISPYKAANMLNERLYLLQGNIPAVKKDGVFYNLMSLENIKNTDRYLRDTPNLIRPYEIYNIRYSIR